MQPTTIVPPPWFLTGDGIVLLYHFPEWFNREHGFLAGYQKEGYKGWIGAVMLVNYTASNVGPYQELLYIPGLFDLGGRLTFSISRIFVSRYNSLLNGRENWGIPKELADFYLTEREDGSRGVEVLKDNKSIFEALIQQGGPRIPVSSRLLPELRLTQMLRSRLLQTSLTVSGHVQLASLRYISADPAFFPPVNQLNPLAVLTVKDFKMKFPVPKIL